ADVHSAMALLALKDGKPEPALLRALTDPQPVVRAGAAEALAQGGGPEALPQVKKLMGDADAVVRLRTALALAPRDAEAIPVLIGLIAVLPADQAWQVHDFMLQLAGDLQAPPSPDDNVEARKKASAAWTDWWKKNSAKVDLARLASPERRFLGYVVVCEHS